MPYADIPLIPQGLRQEETVVQITLALEYLNNITIDIFKHIKTTVEQQESHLQTIRKRTKIVRAKLDKLVGIKKATKVFASAKYPGSDIQNLFVCELLRQPKLVLDFSQVPITSTHSFYDPDSLKEKCQHFHIKSSNKQVRKNVEVTSQQGLGRLPPDIDSVTNLLLFNTAENLYKKYVIRDPLDLASKTKQLDDNEVKEDLDAAPKSMLQDSVDFKPGENYFYAPLLQEVPQLDIPLDLPDLPGIADDLQFFTNDLPSIAPSISTPVLDLPDVASLPTPETTLPSPPMPPPPPPAFIEPPVPSVPPVLSTLVPNIPPPPPPLPPPDVPPPPPSPPHKPAGETTIPTPKPKGGDVRANLMDEIRKAGGREKAKLRSVLEEKPDAKSAKQDKETTKGGGGNLMADLHEKLSLRRKGISGSNAAPANPLEKMLSMIPPPPAKSSDKYEAENSDSDWED